MHHATTSDTEDTSVLTFGVPATTWLEALPLGNGALGAMCWGEASGPRFDLNDETAWSGGPHSERLQPRADAGRAAILLANARRLVAAGRPVEAEAEIAALQSDYTQAYLPLGTLSLDLVPAVPPADGYQRVLDLDDAVHTVRSGGTVQRTIVSHPHGVLMHVMDGFPADASVRIVLRSALRAVGRSDHALLLRLPADVAPGHEPAHPPVTWGDDTSSALEAAIVTRSVVERSTGGDLRLVVFAATATTYRSPLLAPTGTATDAAAAATARIDAAVAAGSDEVLAAHVEDYRRLKGRVSLQLGVQDRTTSTDERLAVAALHPGGPLAADPSLAALLFDYGRYLLISSSRPGGLPATLQGIWNDSMQPPWSSNYTVNINLQMNYWAADVANLPETAEPLLDLIEALSTAGRQTAARLYDARGWVVHHNTDAWAYTSPVGGGHGDPSWAFWPMAGPWLVRHLAERSRFGDPSILDRAWPIIRGAAEFALDWMIRIPSPDPSGEQWGTCPSTSPENRFLTRDEVPASLSTSSTMDLSLLRELFETVIHTAAALGCVDDPIVREVTTRLASLPAAPAIGADGALREWSDDAVAVDRHHRHLSHLYSLYPGSARYDDEHKAAAARSLVARGDDSTGWSLAWKLALWARLERPDKVSDLLRLQFRRAGTVQGPFAGGLYPNLFSAHPPFQIDGNLGFVAALTETLLQSHDGRIRLLPALPPEFPDGRVHGLVARGGIVVDLEWTEHQLRSATLTARDGDVAVPVVYRGHSVHVRLGAGGSAHLGPQDLHGR